MIVNKIIPCYFVNVYNLSVFVGVSQRERKTLERKLFSKMASTGEICLLLCYVLCVMYSISTELEVFSLCIVAYEQSTVI